MGVDGLRDLEADRRLIDAVRCNQETDSELLDIADAALAEIARLRKILVWKNVGGQWAGMIAPCQISGDHPTEDAAWAEVRKEACK